MKKIVMCLLAVLMLCGCSTIADNPRGSKISNNTVCKPLGEINGTLTNMRISYADIEIVKEYNYKEDREDGFNHLFRTINTSEDEAYMNYELYMGLDETIKKSGILDYNGYDVRTYGLPQSAGDCKVDFEFSSGEDCYIRYNGADSPNGFKEILNSLMEYIDNIVDSNLFDSVASSLLGCRQRALDNGYPCTVIKVCDIEGPLGDGIGAIIKDSGLGEDYPFLYEIDYEHVVDVGGNVLYCVIPLDTEAFMSVDNSSGNVFFRSSDGNPILVFSNGDDCYINITDNNGYACFELNNTEAFSYISKEN